MSKLKEYKDKYSHYYVDDQGRIQGELMWWHNNGTLQLHCLCKDDIRHGEHKWWYDTGQLKDHCFYQDNKDITEEIKELVSDILNITDEERLMIKIKFGIECLS